MLTLRDHSIIRPVDNSCGAFQTAQYMAAGNDLRHRIQDFVVAGLPGIRARLDAIEGRLDALEIWTNARFQAVEMGLEVIRKSSVAGKSDDCS